MITIIKDMSMNLRSYQTTCNHCSSIFKHDETDLVKDLPKNATIEVVDCPVCKKRTLAQRIAPLEGIPEPPPPPPPPRSLKPKNTIYELVSDYITIAKKSFKFKP